MQIINIEPDGMPGLRTASQKPELGRRQGKSRWFPQCSIN